MLILGKADVGQLLGLLLDEDNVLASAFVVPIGQLWGQRLLL